MMNGISDQALDDIELRLVGADHRPWAVSHRDLLDDEGRRSVVTTARKAQNKAIREGIKKGDTRLRELVGEGKITESEAEKSRGGEEWIDPSVVFDGLVLFRRTDRATDEMLEFIAHAPEDVETLVREIRVLRVMVGKRTEEREKLVADLQRYKIAADRAEGKIVDMRRAWRTLSQEMGGKTR